MEQALRPIVFSDADLGAMGDNDEKMHAGTIIAAFTAGLIYSPHPVFAGPAEDVQTAMQLLKSKAATLGAASINGKEEVAGKSLPALQFGSTKMNNDFTLVDEVQKEVSGTETIFVKSGDEFVRVSTNVKKDDGSRAIGTILT